MKTLPSKDKHVNSTLGPEQKWLQKISRGVDFRKKTRSTERWKDFLAYYENEFDGAGGGEIFPTYNLVYMFGRALIPSIVYQSPQVVNIARRPEFIPWASALDAVDNWLVQEMELTDIFKKAVLFAYLFNIAPVQLGWDGLPGMREPTGKGALQDALSLEYGFARLPGVTNRARRANFPYLDLIDPNKVVFAPRTRDMRTCAWYAVFRRIEIEQLRRMTGNTKLRPTHVPNDHMFRQDNTDGESLADGTEFSCFWEIHDAATGKYAWIDVDGYAIKPWAEDRLQVDGLNLEAIVFNQGAFSIWGPPDALYVEGQMLDGNDSRKQGMKQRRVSLVKGLIDENILSKAEAEKLFDEDALPLIRVKPGGSKPLSECVAFIQPHVQLEFLQYQNALKQDAQDILGIGSNQLGNLASGRRTRFEVQVVNDNSQARMNERREIVASSIQNIIRKTNQLIIQRWKKPYLTRVIGADLAQYWVRVNPAELSTNALADEITSNVNVSSMAPTSSDRIKQEATELLGLLGNNPNINTVPLIRELLSRFPWIDVTQVLPQAPQGDAMNMDQFQQQQQQLMNDKPGLASSQKENLSAALPALQSRAHQRNQGRTGGREEKKDE